MVTINSNTNNELIIKNSKFIGYLYKVSSIEEIELLLEKTRKAHKDATHVCYAYRIENKEKCSDDGEPTGTAGAPIMDVLEKNDITNVLAIVVRYFGGTLLGAGGLIRAYSKTIREALKLTTLEEIVFYNYYELKANYDDLKLLNTLTKDLNIITKDFGELITYKIKIEKDLDSINELFKNTNIEILPIIPEE